jgi:protein N-terminal glutamine amidohydrolase
MKITSYQYTANFCEENIWHLCQNDELAAFEKTVLIISNKQRNCPLWHQKSAVDLGPVRWDYHVVLLATRKSERLVYDFDSTLGLPTSLQDYLNQTFKPESPSWETDKPLFKAIDADKYINSFYSDRTHMLNSEGDWVFVPPHWPLIKSMGELPLPELLDFSFSSSHQIYSFEEIAEWS